ncbi:protein Red [Nephila pilipes]|uniref:Protein Red n=1 Tax=Nephila pilipes TaxID=299642 RepID=A0A8X6PZF2_NEPPI|nr:protein Red [Nephila pilipes]GFT96924.1 protein Red [Nephila pilipes]
MIIDDGALQYVTVKCAVSKKLASDFLLSTDAHKALRRNVQVYDHESSSEEDLIVDDKEETENPSVNYHAGASDAKSGLDIAERRHQVIQESKFLIGDMEHTHLVNDLNYAVLQNVRNENNYKEKEEEELESLFFKRKDKEEEIQIKIKFVRKIYRQVFKNRYPEKSELFVPNRIANDMDLEDKYTDSDIPITLLRKKAGWSKFGISNNNDY